MADFTPGPWTVGEHRTQFGNLVCIRIDAPSLPTRRGGLAGVNAWTDGREPTSEQAEANARLIASAPCLLAALEGLLRATEDLTGERWEEVRAARAAVARARGQ